MKLSISNIAWEAEWDQEVYGIMQELGYTGLEVAPTRIIPEDPYDHLAEAAAWVARLPFAVSSMQSIWFGREENLFRSPEEREALLSYTRKALAFAGVLGCRNLVFGCPRNRSRVKSVPEEAAIPFFRTLGESAAAQGAVIALEANPPIYHTDFLNTTAEAAAFLRRVDAPGLGLNLDLGTMVENGERPEDLREILSLVNHIHFSEPMLKTLQQRVLHRQIAELAREQGFNGYISIEMSRQDSLESVYETLAYVKEVVGD